MKDISKEILALDTSKLTQRKDIPTKVIKYNSDIVPDFFLRKFINIIEASAFSEQLKYADVLELKKYYRTVQSKRCINNQLQKYFQELLSKYQYDFWKNYRVINALSLMIKEWKNP